MSEEKKLVDRPRQDNDQPTDPDEVEGMGFDRNNVEVALATETRQRASSCAVQEDEAKDEPKFEIQSFEKKDMKIPEAKPFMPTQTENTLEEEDNATERDEETNLGDESWD